MTIFSDLIKGAMILSTLALIQNSCSIRDMAEKAADAHKKGLSSYGAFSRALTK